MVFDPFSLKTGIDFDHYGLKSGMVFKGTTRTVPHTPTRIPRSAPPPPGYKMQSVNVIKSVYLMLL